MKISVRLLIYGTFVFHGLSMYSQTTSSAKNYSDFGLSKVYVQLNKTIYISGETIFYMAINTDAITNKTSCQDKIVYLSILDNTGKTMLTWRSNLNNGIAAGAYKLPDTIQGGAYTLVAYTNWMRNYNPIFLFSTPIIISRMTENELPSSALIDSASKYDFISFYPEGGTLVEGLESRIGYTVINKTMLDDSVTCSIVDDGGLSLPPVKIDKRGFGITTLTPVANKKYKFSCVLMNGNTFQAALPEVLKGGYLLKLLDTVHSFVVEVISNSQQAANSNTKVEIRQGLSLVQSYNLVFKSGLAMLEIEKSQLPAGIMDMKVFDNKNNLVGERLFFNKRDVNNLTLTLSDTLIKKKTKSKISLHFKGIDSNDTAYLSICISKQEPLPRFFKQNNFYSYISLASEFSGISFPIVVQPSDPSVIVNNLLTGVNPKYYSWNIITGFITKNKFISEKKGFLLSGRIESKTTGKPLPNACILLSSPDSSAHLTYCYTNKEGVFNFLLNSWYDNRGIYLQLLPGKLVQNDIQWFFDTKSIPFVAASDVAVYLNDSAQDYISNSRKIHLVEAINVVNKNLLNSNVSDKARIINYSFYGMPDLTINPADFEGLETFDDIVYNLMPGVKIKKSDDELYLQLYDPISRQTLDPQYMVLLNGVPYSDLNFILKLPVNTIGKVEVCQRKIMYGDVTFDGIVSIVTTDIKMPQNFAGCGIKLFKNQVQPFVVSAFQQLSSKPSMPDLRSTLYWGQAVVGSVQSEISIPYTTSDLKGRYEVQVQGITKSGIPLLIKSFIEVQ